MLDSPQPKNQQIRKSQIRYGTQITQNKSEGNFAPQVNLLSFFKQRTSLSKKNSVFQDNSTPKPSIHLQPIQNFSTPQLVGKKQLNTKVNLKQYFQKDLLNQQKKEQPVIIEQQDSDSSAESGESVVWDNDELKMRGLELNGQRQSKAEIDQFSDLFKYRYESFPQRRSNISFQRVLHIAKVYASSNIKSQQKYNNSTNQQKKIEIDFTQPYNPFQDKNFKEYDQYVDKTQKRPRKLKKIRLPQIETKKK